jgi:hypothetical protein
MSSRDDTRCHACAGGAIPCKGGGNLHCRKRDPRPARLALILDSYGGARTIVGTRQSIKANTRHDEICHLVPKLIVHEPIAWGDIPIVIERARLEFENWLATLPNLTEDEQRSVTLYRLRQLERPDNKGALNIEGMVET